MTPRRNISLACAPCRKRKIRCDGIQPVCNACRSRNAMCDYNDSTDGRTVKHLRRRIAELEEALHRAEHGGSSTREQSSSHISLPTGGGPSYRPVDSLRMNPLTGNVSFFGPSSIPPRASPERESGDDHFPIFPSTILPSTPAPVADIPPDTHGSLVDMFFTYLNGFLAFVDEKAFRDGMSRHIISPANWLDPQAGYTPFLHACILAVASHISADPAVYPPGRNDDSSVKGLAFLNTALSLLEHELDKPRPTTLQGLALLVISLCEVDKLSLMWIIGGNLTHVAIGLGLQVDTRPLVKNGTMSAGANHQRENAFWIAHVMDKLVALFVGRQPALYEEDYDLKHPIPVPGRMSPCLVSLVGLSDICGRVFRLLYRVRKYDRDTGADRLGITMDLRKWYDQFPKDLAQPDAHHGSPPVMWTIHALYNTVVILFNKPLLGRQCLEQDEGRLCFDAALSTANVLSTLDQLHGIEKAPITNCQNMYAAGSLLTLLLADLYDQDHRAGERELAQTTFDQLIHLLTKFSQSWSLASQVIASLRSLQREYHVAADSPPEFDFEKFLQEAWSTVDFSSFPSLDLNMDGMH